MIDSMQYGPWALIAGASEGVGAAFARKLAMSGINLVLLARQENLLDALAREAANDGGVQVRKLVLDLTRADMLERVREVTDGVEVGLVVYNAGAAHGGGPFLQASSEVALNLIRLNPVGQVVLSHHFGNKMAARGHGGIILMGSLAGNAGGASVVAYSAAKAFTQIFAEGLWSELKPLGVDVLCVVLGATDTPARARLGLKDSPGQIVADPADVAQSSLDNIANGPVLVPEHLVGAFRQFCSLPRKAAAEAMRDLLLSFNK